MLRTLPVLLLFYQSFGSSFEDEYFCPNYELCIPDNYPDMHFKNISDTVYVNVALLIENGTQGFDDALKNIDVNRMELSFTPTIIWAWQDPFLKLPRNKTTNGLDYMDLDSFLFDFIMKPEEPKIMQALKKEAQTHDDIGKSGNVFQ